MKTKKIIRLLTLVLSGILLTPFLGNAETTGVGMQKDLLNPDTIFNYVGLGLVVAFFLTILWVLTSAMRNLSDALKNRQDTTHSMA